MVRIALPRMRRWSTSVRVRAVWLWRRQDQHPLLATLLDRFAETGRRSRWLSYQPGEDWLPPRTTPRSAGHQARAS
jgi:hypothetical protein